MADYSKEVDEYLEHGGVYCPFCHSDDIISGPMKTDVGIAWQHAECCKCGSTWRDEYDLVNISNIEKGNKV